MLRDGGGECGGVLVWRSVSLVGVLGGLVGGIGWAASVVVSGIVWVSVRDSMGLLLTGRGVGVAE